MAAKCNITTSTLKKLQQLFWGMKGKNVDDSILENYIEYLGYENLVVCDDADCVNETVVVTCALSITSIQVAKYENLVIFNLLEASILNGTPPYSYQWNFEEDDFNLSGATGLDTATLTVKPNKDTNYIITNISVTVTDSNGCITTKSCWLTPSGMQCADDYAACVPISDLKVTNKTILCGVLKSLVVSKKL